MAIKTGVTLALGILTFAGCIDSLPTPDPVVGLAVPLLAPPLADALWNDPQLFPHPAYNWPTITHVPAGAPDLWVPVPARDLPAAIRSIDHLAQSGTGTAGDGIALFGRIAINPAGVIFDLADPAKPVVLADLDVKPAGRMVVLIPFPDGRLYAAFATGTGYIPIWDITDPANAEEVSVIDVPSGGHAIAVVPGTPILYNANAVGSRYYPHEVSGGRSIQQVEIYDLSTPDTPILVKEWKEGYGCHLISFHLSPAKLRAYCAAVDSTQIWDVTDPLAPTVITTIPAPHGMNPVPGLPLLATVSHHVVVNADATVMAVADEFLGGAGPGCDVHQTVAGKSVSGPAGNVHFFDIRDETKPVLKGWINPGSHFTYNNQGTSCTAHVGHMIPQADRDVMAMSFYAGGVGVIDFTDPTNPRFIDTWQQAQPMDVWYYQGYLFAGDAAKGLDVLTLG